MKTTRHFLLYLPQFFLEWEMSLTKVVEEIKTPILHSLLFSQIVYLWDNVENVLYIWQATDANMIRRMRIPKSTERDSSFLILIAFPRQQFLYERGSVLRFKYIAPLV
jgi:predicted thioredoxin/glutaredoxin